MTIFTKSELQYAKSILKSLLLERRFFLDIPEYLKHLPVYKEVLKLQNILVQKYKDEGEKAKKNILVFEDSLGFSQANVPKNQQLVQCNRYGGGYNIKSIFPLSHFTKGVDLCEERLYKERVLYLKSLHTVDEISVVELNKIKQAAKIFSSKICSQWEQLQQEKSYNNLSVLLLQTCFNPVAEHGVNMGLEKISMLVKYPELLGYLFHEKSKAERFVKHDYVLFNTNRAHHVKMSHWSDATSGHILGILYEERGGYSCKVHFACIV